MELTTERFSMLLRELMKERNVTSAELARRSGVRADLVYKYRSGRYMPSADKVCAIARALGVTPNDLLGW